MRLWHERFGLFNIEFFLIRTYRSKKLAPHCWKWILKTWILWDSQDPGTYSDWMSNNILIVSRVFSFNEPNGGLVENCLIVDMKMGSLGVFDDRCDRYGTGVVCEYIPDWSLAEIPPPSTTLEPEIAKINSELKGISFFPLSRYSIILGKLTIRRLLFFNFINKNV